MKFMALLPLATLTVALAQAPRPARDPGRAGGFDELKAYLNLDDAQIQQITQARRQAFQNARPLAEQIAQAQRELRQMLESPNPDATEVGKQTLAIRSLREQLRNTRQSVSQSVLNVLTPEQKTKLANLEEAAKLTPAVRQAMRLGLIEPPERPAGRVGPAGRGMRGYGQGRFGPRW